MRRNNDMGHNDIEERKRSPISFFLCVYLVRFRYSAHTLGLGGDFVYDFFFLNYYRR